MSRYLPHTPYAEDQPYPHSILTAHVLYRGFQAGAFLGCTTGLSYSTYRYFRPTISATISPPLSLHNHFLPNALRPTGIGAAAGIAILTLGLTGRMRGKEEIEWQDRAWRLLENEGQLSTDEWSLGGTAAAIGLAVLGARRGVLVIKNRPMAVVGAAGLGSLIGSGSSLIWRAVHTVAAREDDIRLPSDPQKRQLEE